MALRAMVNCLMISAVICNGCDKTFTAVSGEIRSPGSSAYPNNADCTYTIKGSPRIRVVEFTFERFRTEKKHDSLKFGEDKYSGSQPKGKQLNYTFSNSFTLRFTTDGSVTYSGFVVKYNLLPECSPGYYGQNCSTCSSGCSDVCNKKTGSCTCKKGTTGKNCDAECPSGTYDSYCTESCSPGCVNGSCDKEDGSCSCKSGYQGLRCDNRCFRNRYGPNCESRCSSGCVRSYCDRITGSCKCRPGWTGEKCDQECATGMYGLNCNKSCSSGCANTCNKQNGNCNCRAGWKGGTCDAECPADRHGVNCESSCSPGCEDGACDSESGLCTCTAGWMGDKCLEECENSTYGTYCKHTCSDGCVNNTCNAVNGTCSCIYGYLGDRCSFNMIVIASVSVGVLAAILVPVLVFILISRRRKKRKEESVLEKTTKISDALTMKNLSRESPEGNEYVGYDDDVIYVDPMDIDEDEYENFSYSHEQNSVSETARNTDNANEDSLYGNVHITGHSKRVGGTVAYDHRKDDFEEELEYGNVMPRRSNRNRTKRPR